MNNDEIINIDDDAEGRNDSERLTTADMAGTSAAPTRARTGTRTRPSCLMMNLDVG